jgi:hypothetical protein
MMKFEQDALNNPEFVARLGADLVFAQNVYAAICNNDLIDLATGDDYGMTWRAAASFVAHLRNLAGVEFDETYLTWYCSGMVDIDGWVEEGAITDDVRLAFKTLGWGVRPMTKTGYTA